MRLLPSPVELTFPPENRFVELAQVVASGVAMACGLALEDIEDFRLVVDEICEALIETNSGGPVRLVFRMVENRLVVDASTAAHDEPRPDRVALGDKFLAILTDGHERVVEDGQLRYAVSRDLRAGGVG